MKLASQNVSEKTQVVLQINKTAHGEDQEAINKAKQELLLVVQAEGYSTATLEDIEYDPEFETFFFECGISVIGKSYNPQVYDDVQDVENFL